MREIRECSDEQWWSERRALLAREKELTRLRDELSAARRELPWRRVTRAYTFEGERGTSTLADLFGPHGQLVVYHFMFAPGAEAGCRGCSFWADNFERNVVHLAARDVSLVAVSRAPRAELAAFARRMGFTFPWFANPDGAFARDYQVSFTDEQFERGDATYNYATLTNRAADLPGVSVFARGADGGLFHTYSTYARGLEPLNAAYGYLDLVPKGRDEGELAQPMAWLRHRDGYGA